MHFTHQIIKTPKNLGWPVGTKVRIVATRSIDNEVLIARSLAKRPAWGKIGSTTSEHFELLP